MLEKRVEPPSVLRVLQQFTVALGHAKNVEEVYAFGLDAVQDLFQSTRAFVAISESHLSTNAVCLPIRFGRESLGCFMINLDEPWGPNEQELAYAQLIAAQTGAAIHTLHEQQRIRESLEAARETARLKDEFIAMAVHELRSPLTAIIGGTMLLRKSGMNEIEHATGMIERNARTQGQLIEDLLNLSQLDAGKVQLQWQTLDLVPLIAQVVNDILPTASATQTAIHTQFCRPLMVRGDQQRLWQIFWNLLSNAVRFASPNGEIRIVTEAVNRIAEIQISDNGIGISPDALPYVFDRFRQAHRPRSQWYDGLGLGLAIVKEFVLLHGGNVMADSPGPGKGSTFKVRLPASV